MNLTELGESVEVFTDDSLADHAITNDFEKMFRRGNAQSREAPRDLGHRVFVVERSDIVLHGRRGLPDDRYNILLFSVPDTMSNPSHTHFTESETKIASVHVENGH